MRRILLAAAAALALLSNASRADITLQAAADTDPALQAAVQQGVDGFNRFIRGRWHMRIEQPITVQICTTQADYEAAYRAQQTPNALDPNAGLGQSTTGGVAFPAAHLILLNLRKGMSPYASIFVMAHELTHFLQNQMLIGSAEPSKYWITEGMADWVAAQVTDQLGLMPRSRWQAQPMVRLRHRLQHTTPQALMDLVLYAQWQTS